MCAGLLKASHSTEIRISMIPVDSQEGAVDSKQQTELRFAGLCVSVDSNQGPVDSYTQSQLSGFWIACACRQL
ncbi:hypothetical protein Taro_017288 [Colocasia esculenta]|uniref:Uncharacterized protein n=1 Tax=Colocasia esculenta TaxID=4460 RepID=A0A843UST6_COLES|nr:hypothetical protein [Colocasia esculenta]